MSTIPTESCEPGDVEPTRLALPLRLAPGTELLGRYESSAFSQPQYLIRRGDGQILQVGHLAYTLAASLDGMREGAGIASAMSAALGRPVSIDNVEYLVGHKLFPLGILATEGAATALTRVNPLLGLRFRARVVPERLHRGATWLLQPLFRLPVVATVLAGVLATTAWVFVAHRSSLVHGTQDLVLHPALLLLLIALTVAAGAFHELGHATAARYGGAKPGVMGVGIYLMLPAFYTDVSDSYRLDRRGRLRTDLGGVYFNGIAILVAAGAFFLTQSPALLVFIALTEVEVLYQFLPFIRMDGYYVVSDLIGVPNLFAFVGPVFAAMLRRPAVGTERLRSLTRGARVAIRTWVGLTVPILAFDLAMFVWLAPHFFPGMWRAAQLFEKSTAYNLSRGNVVPALDNIVQLVFLAVPAIGLVLMAGMVVGRALHRLGAPLARPVKAHPRWAMATLAVGAALLIAFIVPGGRVGEAQRPTSAAAGPRPGFRAPAPSQVVAAGRARPAPVLDAALGDRGEGPLVAPGRSQAPTNPLQPAGPAPEPGLATRPDLRTRAGTGAPPSPAPAGSSRGDRGPGAGAPSTGPLAAPGGAMPAPSVSAAVATPVATVSVAAPVPAASLSVTAPVPSVPATVPVPAVGASVTTPVASVAIAPAPAAGLSVATPVGPVTATAPVPRASLSVATPVGAFGVDLLAPPVATSVAAPGGAETASVAVPSVEASVSAPLASAQVSLGAPSTSASPTARIASVGSTSPAPSVSVATPVASVAAGASPVGLSVATPVASLRASAVTPSAVAPSAVAAGASAPASRAADPPPIAPAGASVSLTAPAAAASTSLSTGAATAPPRTTAGPAAPALAAPVPSALTPAQPPSPTAQRVRNAAAPTTTDQGVAKIQQALATLQQAAGAPQAPASSLGQPSPLPAV
jgi:putative peptide zinc metalloprotease protein